MRRLLVLPVLLLAACNAPHAPAPAQPAPAVQPRPLQPAVALSGRFADGTPLTLAALKGRPWVVNLWLPG